MIWENFVFLVIFDIWHFVVYIVSPFLCCHRLYLIIYMRLPIIVASKLKKRSTPLHDPNHSAWPITSNSIKTYILTWIRISNIQTKAGEGGWHSESHVLVKFYHIIFQWHNIKYKFKVTYGIPEYDPADTEWTH